MNQRNITNFDAQLLDHIGRGHNLEAKFMLNRDLAKAFSIFGTLLHYAVSHDNVDITRHLIELGSEVDAIGRGSETPLRRAVDRESSLKSKEIVGILLEAGASIYIADDSGQSALQKVFKMELVQMEGIFQQFIHRVREDTSSIEELASRLVDACCTICHAVYLEDVQLLECMRQRGAVEVNPLDNRHNTPLHVAAQLGNMTVVEWLLHTGSDVNVRNELNETPLHRALGRCKKDVLRLLLERGADPNAEWQEIGMTPLWQTVFSMQHERELLGCYTECFGMLIEFGSIPRNLNNKLRGAVTIFDVALANDWRSMTELLLAYLTMLQKLGICNAEAVIVCSNPRLHAELERVKNDYKTCQQKLDVVIFGTSTLFDLLIDQQDFNRLRMLVRNETFDAKVDQICSEHELGDRYGYYYKNLMKHVAKAKRIVELEDKAIPVIVELFEGSYNQCFNFARKVVGYLNERDLEQLILV